MARTDNLYRYSNKNTNEIGRSGESLAEKFLKKSGYKIIEKNFRTKFGEIDIISEYRNTIVFVEVRTRKNSDFGVPQLSVNIHKQRRLSLAALTFIKKNLLNSDYRFDIIAICSNKIEHIKNAFVPLRYTV
ncbi:MAG: YraN family protein [Elusimicrobia bacterium]|nr:YraN family protein [Elusimicrobiota bacterium]